MTVNADFGGWQDDNSMVNLQGRVPKQCYGCSMLIQGQAGNSLAKCIHIFLIRAKIGCLIYPHQKTGKKYIHSLYTCILPGKSGSLLIFNNSNFTQREVLFQGKLLAKLQRGLWLNSHHGLYQPGIRYSDPIYTFHQVINYTFETIMPAFTQHDVTKQKQPQHASAQGLNKARAKAGNVIIQIKTLLYVHFSSSF